MSFRASVEKSPAVETIRNIPAPAHLPAVARYRAGRFLKPSPSGEGGTSVSEANRVTDEGSYNDESSVIEQPLTTACGGASPKGEALIGYDVIASEARQSRGNEMPPTHPRRHTCPRGLRAERERTLLQVNDICLIFVRCRIAVEWTIVYENSLLSVNILFRSLFCPTKNRLKHRTYLQFLLTYRKMVPMCLIRTLSRIVVLYSGRWLTVVELICVLCVIPLTFLQKFPYFIYTFDLFYLTIYSVMLYNMKYTANCCKFYGE